MWLRRGTLKGFLEGSILVVRTISVEYKLSLVNAREIEPFPRAVNQEVDSIVKRATLDLDSAHPRKSLSGQFIALFEAGGWKRDANLYFEPSRVGTTHYLKNRMLVQVSWRHYEKIGTEMLRFQVEYDKEHITGGVYICVSKRLVDTLKKRHPESKESRNLTTSITMEKAVEYLSIVGEAITVPIAIMGLIP